MNLLPPCLGCYGNKLKINPECSAKPYFVCDGAGIVLLDGTGMIWYLYGPSIVLVWF